MGKARHLTRVFKMCVRSCVNVSSSFIYACAAVLAKDSGTKRPRIGNGWPKVLRDIYLLGFVRLARQSRSDPAWSFDADWLNEQVHPNSIARETRLFCFVFGPLVSSPASVGALNRELTSAYFWVSSLPCRASVGIHNLLQRSLYSYERICSPSTSTGFPINAMASVLFGSLFSPATSVGFPIV